MKNLFVLFSLILFSLSIKAQEQKVEIVSDSLFITHDKPIIQHAVLFNCGAQGVAVEYVSSDYFLPFKLYDFYSKKENWITIQSIYNTIQSKVPNVSISASANIIEIPNISMRGDDNTIIIVDGIRYDASVLNTLNPSDIESITVAPSAAATNYLRNN